MARSSLREFQERLARRLAEAAGAERRGLLGFQCGGHNWLIELAEAGEILPPPPLSAVPLTRPWFRGLANVRGSLYGVVDFAAFNGQPPISAGGPRAPAADRCAPRHPQRAAGVVLERAAQPRGLRACPRPTTPRPGWRAGCATCRAASGCSSTRPACSHQPAFLDAGLE